MKKRILLPNGKFVPYDGPKRKLHKSASPEQKIAEHKKVKEISDKHGFDITNPDEGGLSEVDVKLLKSGEMSLMAVVSLANNRKIEIPEGMEVKSEIIAHLLGDVPEAPKAPIASGNDEGKVLSRMSIPEMRAYAKAQDIKIPGTIKKKVDMCAFLEGSTPVVEDDL